MLPPQASPAAADAGLTLTERGGFRMNSPTDRQAPALNGRNQGPAGA